jgi:hypothetical protein
MATFCIDLSFISIKPVLICVEFSHWAGSGDKLSYTGTLLKQTERKIIIFL